MISIILKTEKAQKTIGEITVKYENSNYYLIEHNQSYNNI